MMPSPTAKGSMTRVVKVPMTSPVRTLFSV